MALPLEVAVQGTPNPNAMKLTLNRIITTEGKTYHDPATADAAWAKALLGVSGIIGLYAVNNFISINKAPDADWEAILPQAERALRQALA